jgi:tripartite-type tricarboxylate transporter receptor subunit TctC
MKMKTVGMMMFVAILVFSIGLPTVYCQSSAGDTVEGFYRGKTMTCVVSSEPGGGNDTVARILVPHLARATGTKVIVKNMTGGSLEGDNWVYSEAKRDGLTILAEGTMPLLLNDLLKSAGAQYVTEKFIFLGGAVPELTVCAVSGKLTDKTLDGLRKAKGLRVGASSARGYVATAGAITSAILGLDAKLITGYKGLKSVLLAVAQGEMDMVVASEPDVAIAVKGGDVVPLFVVGEERSPLYPNLPTIRELGVNIPKELTEAYKTITTNSRALALPPGVPDDRVSYLRSAFKKMGETKELQADISRWAGIFRPFISGERMQEDINHIKANKALASQIDGIFKKYSAAK